MTLGVWKKPIPVIPSVPLEQLGCLYPAINRCFDAGREMGGGEEKQQQVYKLSTSLELQIPKGRNSTP